MHAREESADDGEERKADASRRRRGAQIALLQRSNAPIRRRQQNGECQNGMRRREGGLKHAVLQNGAGVDHPYFKQQVRRHHDDVERAEKVDVDPDLLEAPRTEEAEEPENGKACGDGERQQSRHLRKIIPKRRFSDKVAHSPV